MNINTQLLKTDSSSIRLDKNIANSIDVIWLDELGLSQEDRSLIKSVLYYICVERQTNLFGYGTLDPAHFADVMKYPENYLRKPHSAPIQLRNLTEEEQKEQKAIEKNFPERKIMDSLLENALYVLHTQTLQLRQGSKEIIFENNGTIAKYTTLSKSYVFLPELEITAFKKKGGQKIVYSYKVDSKFINNLSLYFLRFNKDSVVALRRCGNDDLYLHLKDFKDILLFKKRNGDDYNRAQNFEFLCKKAQIQFNKKNGEPKDNREIKRELNKVLKTISEKSDLLFDVKWEKKINKSRWSYYPNFYFKEVEKYNPKSIVQNSFVTREKKDEKTIIFKENLLHELLETCRRYNDLNEIKEGIETVFFSWLIGTKNKLEKKLAFQNAQLSTFGSLHKDIEAITKDWLSSLESLQSLDDLIKKWEQFMEKTKKY